MTCGGWDLTSATSETARDVIELCSTGLIHISRKSTAGMKDNYMVELFSKKIKS